MEEANTGLAIPTRQRTTSLSALPATPVRAPSCFRLISNPNDHIYYISEDYFKERRGLCKTFVSGAMELNRYKADGRLPSRENQSLLLVSGSQETLSARTWSLTTFCH